MITSRRREVGDGDAARTEGRRRSAVDQPRTSRSSEPFISFLDAMHDPKLFGAWFDPPSSWATWRIVAKALFGEQMSRRELETFSKITARSKPPGVPSADEYFAV